jgi:hypothetical protein
MQLTSAIPQAPASRSLRLVRMLWSSLRTVRELKNWLTTIPAWVIVRASR